MHVASTWNSSLRRTAQAVSHLVFCHGLGSGGWGRSEATPPESNAGGSLRSNPGTRDLSRWIAVLVLACSTGILSFSLAPGTGVAAEIDDAQALFNSGQYSACTQMATVAIEKGAWDEAWPILKIRSEMAVGEYKAARATMEAALRRYPSSVRLRLTGHQVWLYNNLPGEAESTLLAIQSMATQIPSRYSSISNRVNLGRAFLLLGADARQVLEIIYDPAKKEQPDYADVYVASAELALEKEDYALAAESIQRAAELEPKDPYIQYLVAKAYASDDPERASAALSAALAINPRHVDSLLFQADRLIDGERYDEAGDAIDQVLAVNRWHPKAWAYRAVIAHLNGTASNERLCRKTALFKWSTNHEVDHLIGQKLSQKYRFAEGADYQRRSLVFNPDYLPAKTQLSQDLLRLGEEEEGWRLAEEVHEFDGYNVLAYNLVTLRDNLAKFRTLEDDDFIVRMDADEAQIYGDRVMELLHRAKRTLCEKYDVLLDGPVTVEIFPEQKDFAIRTFGMPGGVGFLGVCFGNVITANSPASQGESPSNWQSVLWHEFCHVVTLNKTHNKMPRWLSEGISVYEELQADPTWGQSMNPRYREMVLGGELTPVSRLSDAFLSPPSPLHLQFAYYESALVVEYLVERHGLETLKAILGDLGDGRLINEALAAHTGSLAELDREFELFARETAFDLGPDVDWSQPELAEDADAESLAAWNEDHPDNFRGLHRWARRLVSEKRWEEAKEPLFRLIELYPGDVEGESAYLLLVIAHRQLGETNEERAVLEKLASLDADAVEVYLRLAELAAAEEDWPAVLASAQRTLAVNPLLPAPHRYLAEAGESLQEDALAIDSYRALLLMDPLDPAEAHFRLAGLLERNGETAEARREVVQSLEYAPRYREAHRLLLEIVAKMAPETEPADQSELKKAN